MIRFPNNKFQLESLGLWVFLVAILSLLCLWIISGLVYYFERVGIPVGILLAVLSIAIGWVVENNQLPQAITNGIAVIWFLMIVLLGLLRMFQTLTLSGLGIWILFLIIVGYIVAYFDETHPIEDPSLDTN